VAEPGEPRPGTLAFRGMVRRRLILPHGGAQNIVAEEEFSIVRDKHDLNFVRKLLGHGVLD
jgi:hypothetical protein